MFLFISDLFKNAVQIDKVMEYPLYYVLFS